MELPPTGYSLSTAQSLSNRRSKEPHCADVAHPALVTRVNLGYLSFSGPERGAHIPSVQRFRHRLARVGER